MCLNTDTTFIYCIWFQDWRPDIINSIVHFHSRRFLHPLDFVTPLLFCHYSEHITNWTFLYTNWGKKLQFYIKEYDFGVHGIHFVRTNDFTTCNLHYADKYLNDLQIAIHVCKLIQPCIFIKWVILLQKKCKQ